MYRSFKPAEKLSPFIECYWSWHVEPDDRIVDDIFPDAAPEFIVHLASVPFVKNVSGEWTRQPKAFLYCSALHTLGLSIREPMTVFAVRFRPWGVSRFSQQSMATMLDRPVDPFEALNELGDELVAGVSGSDSDGDRIETANRLLESALQTPAQNEGRLKLLLDATNGGRCKAADIARSLAMSDRSFSRLWKEIVGIEPRRFVQIMRFHNALTMIAEGDELAAVAAACGFSDQPHMARQIKAISGLPPSSLRMRLGDRAYRALYESRPGAPWLGRKKP
jgi:AraC-like DNA-binding protein